MLGSHMIKSWSSTQGNVALSSGEAESYGLVKGASVAIGVKSMLKEFGVQADAEVHSDATAAIGMVFGQAHSSRTRRIDTAYLWVQDAVVEKRSL